MKTAEYISFTIDRLPKGYVFTYADFTTEVNKKEAEKIQVKFRKTSGRLQENFRKASGKSLPNWFLILELLVIYPDINAEDISKIIGVSERTVYKNFNELQKKKLIERIGGRKEGFWQIIKQV